MSESAEHPAASSSKLPDMSSTAGTAVPAIQPLQNPRFRHISRSAAKRESVQMLGSIKDLQMHFARAGLVEHRPGSGVGVKGLNSLDEDEENIPPASSSSGSKPVMKERKPWKEVDLPRIDPNTARREARGLVYNLRNTWSLGGGSSGMVSSATVMFPTSPTVSMNLSSPTTPGRINRGGKDSASVLVNTAQTIRRIRSLVLSVSNPVNRKASGSNIHLAPPKANKPRSSFSTPSRPSSGSPLPRAVSHGSNPPRKSSLGPSSFNDAPSKADELAELRKAALEVLGGLRALEESLRIEVETPPRPRYDTITSESDTTASSILSDQESARPTSTTFTEPDIYDSDEEDYSLNALAQHHNENAHLVTWEDRIIQEGRMYREMESDEERWDNVRDSVRKWVGVVEHMFGVREGQTPGELEEWAKDQWQGRETERLFLFINAHLPEYLQKTLPRPGHDGRDRELVSYLTDGFVLTQAFNSAVLSSSQTWGFIPIEDIHETSRTASPSPGEGDHDEAVTDKAWTFRRVNNLTCWAAALRHRYKLPITMPSHPSTTLLNPPSVLPNRTSSVSPATSRQQSPSPALGPGESGSETTDNKQPTTRSGFVKRGGKDVPLIAFDPLVVAKRADGWEEMFLGVLHRWVLEVSEEERSARA